jgi:hypothetical protein
MRREALLKDRIQWLDWPVRLFIASSAVYFFSFVSADPDLWGHVKFGEALWETKTLSPHNLYSFTAPNHPWINHEWLSELFFYATYRFFGDTGLLLLKLGVGLVIVWLIYDIALFRGAQIVVLAMGLGLVISVMSPGFMVRPHIFSLLFFALFFHILHCYLERQKNKLWLLPFIMIIWCNSHGGFLIGWVQYTVVLVWQGLAWIFKERKVGPSLKVLLFWYLLTTAACFVTPNGIKLLAFLYHSLSQPRPIGEWDPIGLWDTSFLRFKVLAAAFVVSLAYPSPQNKRWEIAMIGATIVFAFKHQRHVPFFAIMVGPYLVEWLSLLLASLQLNMGKTVLSRASCSVLFVFFLLVAAYHIGHATYRYMKAGFHIIVDPLYYPVQAVQFMQTNEIKGNVLLPFEWGEYAIWKLYPSCLVSIDGRFRTAYPETVLRDHIFPANDDAAWTRLIDMYPADIILSRQIPFFWNMIRASKDWVYIYSDRAAIIFVRNNAKNRNVLKNLRDGKLVYPQEPVSVYFP